MGIKNFIVVTTISLIVCINVKASDIFKKAEEMGFHPSIYRLEPVLSERVQSGRREPVIFTVGGDINCDYSIIKDAIAAVPNGVVDYEIRLADNISYQENLKINKHSLTIKGGYDDCVSAVGDLSNGGHTQINGSTEALPVISIHNPANYTNRKISIESIDLTGGIGNNSLEMPGGGISAYNANAEIYLTDMLIHDNTGDLGGGIYSLGDATTWFIEDVLVVLNEADMGGGLFCDNSTVFVYGQSGISANKAVGASFANGGGVHAENACNFWLFSGTEGGFFDFRGIAGNQANLRGGGIYAESSNITLFGQQFGNIGDNTNPVNITGNEADAEDDQSGFAGGIYAENSTVLAYSLLLNRNKADDDSAAYFVKSDVAINSASTTCWNAEGLCNQIKNNEIKDSSDIHSKTIAFLGGVSNIKLKISGAEIANNQAGRATFLFLQGSQAELEGNVITGNGDNGLSGHADRHLIDMYSYKLRMVNNTVVDNNVTKALIQVSNTNENSPSMILGSILHESNSIKVIDGDAAENVSFSCVVTHDTSSFVGTNMFIGDPEFVDRANGDFHLQPSSPAIDMCSEDDAIPNQTDIDHQDRGWDVPGIMNMSGPFDVGADEYIPSITADVSVDLALDDTGPFYSGQLLTYTATVSNLGPDIAASVLFDLDFHNLSIQSVEGVSCNVFPCNVGNLDNQESIIITIKGKIMLDDVFNISASAYSNSFDNNQSNNIDNTENGGAVTEFFSDLSVQLTLETDPPYYHTQLVTYRAVVTNNGPDDVEDVLFTKGTLIANLDLHSISGSGCKELPCVIDSINVGESSEPIMLVYEIKNNGSFRGSVKASTQTFWTDSVIGNNQGSTDQITASSLVDLTIKKTLITQPPYDEGQTVEYLIEYSNIGIDGAFMTFINDEPENITITSVNGSGCSSFPCSVGTLAGGAEGSINVTATINQSGYFNNSATIDSQAGYDPEQSNNVDGNNGAVTQGSDIIFISGFE